MMLGSDKSIENLQQLFVEFKQYLKLQKEYTQLELTEKLTILVSTLIIGVILFTLGLVALFYFMFAIAYLIAPLVGGISMSFFIITLIDLLLLAFIYTKRKKYIIQPVTSFLYRLFIESDKKKKS